MRKLLSLLVCLVAPLLAQFETSTVLGTVKDRTEAMVSEAKVTLTNVETNISVSKDTDENGSYEFGNVKPGRYSVAAEKVGFAAARAEGFTVNVGARQRVDLTMSVGQVSESVSVSAAVSLVESDSSQRGQVIEEKKIVELPLNGRNYADLALLSTGVRRSAYAVANPPREGAFNVNGQRSTFNNFLLDGVDNNSYGTSNQGFSNQVVNLPPDAIQEFRIVTNNMSAEYGRTSGAMINAAMKSGTNGFHGSLWEFLRNDKLNAVGFFAPPGGQKPTLKRNQFGFVFGGPIVKDRAFFFTDWEGFRERTGFLVTSQVPTANQRLGILPRAVTNPLTGRVYPANTAIPQADYSPLSRYILNNLPQPNSAGAGANAYVNLRSDRNNTDKMDARLDGQVNSRLSAFVRLSHRKTNLFQAPEIPGLAGGGGNGFIRILNQQLAFGTTWTPSASSLLEFRMGFSKTRAGKEPPFIGGESMQSLFGIPGLSEDPRLTGGITAQSVPGFSAFGRQSTNPQWQHPFLWNPRLNYSKILGRHSIKAGYEWQRIHTEVQDVNPLYGLDEYSGAEGNGFTGVPIADFIFGLRNRYSLTNFFIAQYRQVGNMAYVQDDYRVNTKLTLNLGVRYEYFTPQWEADNRLSNFDPATRTLIPASDGSIEDRAQVNPDRNNWAPRVGLAYSIDPKTVIRSGYGISYIHFNRSGGGNLLAINGPQVVNAIVNQAPLVGGQGGQLNPSFRSVDQGYPNALTNPDRFVAATSNISYIPRDTKTGYVQNWFFSVQREILRNTVVDLAYVGNRSNKLVLFADLNQARPQLTPTGNESLAARRPIPGYAGITITTPSGFANYNALQAKVERRFSTGLSFLNSFTWSKAIDNVGQALEDQGQGNRSSPQNYYDLRAEKGPSGYDQRINNTTSVVWDIPVGRGRRFGSSLPGVLDYAIGGWTLSAINTVTTGEPLNVLWTPAANIQVSDIGPDWRGAISYRPNLIGTAKLTDTARAGSVRYLDRAAFAGTTPDQPFGNVGRNSIYGPNFQQLDLNVQKNFRFTERFNMQFRSEFFNIFNKTNFRAPVVNWSAGNFGQFTTTYPARQIQFALKLQF
ncbi:MAG: TonB-dependent receptor [Bryobacteraceae bacterium]|nr:TonB-dependent receptor [Bryobacteraceae bacterium]